MRRLIHLHALLASTLCWASLAAAQGAATAYPARLAGHAVLPAASFIQPPADAPADFTLSGKFSNGQRNEQVGSLEGLSANRPTGLSLPFEGQPLQGHSGIKHMPDGSFWVLTDNGFGTKANSADAMLYLNHYAIDFKSGEFKRLDTVFLSDPDTALRLFGKPRVDGHRRVGVTLARADSIDAARAKARVAAEALQIQLD